MKKLKISIDFDGTIVNHDFPEIGKPMEDAFRVMKRIMDAGHKLILFTCREDCLKRDYLSEAVDFCKENGITFRSVNANSPLDEFRDKNGLNRKPYCDLYIDDRNFGGFPGWLAVEKYFVENNWL